MSAPVAGKWVVPNPQVPRTFGILNIIFGVLLCLTAAGYLAFLMISPAFQKQIVVQMKDEMAKQKAKREEKLAELKTKEEAAKAKEAAAKTKDDIAKAKEEKDAITEERENVEEEFEPDMTAMTDVMGWDVMADFRLKIYYLSEVISAILLNVLMVVSGAGMLGLAEWGRRLSLGIAWLKIVRWVAMTVVTMVLILPITVEKMDKMSQSLTAQIQAQAKAKGSAPPPAIGPMLGLGKMAAIFGAITMVFSALFSSIYPGLSLWFLTRPTTRAAFMARSKPVEPADVRLDTGELS